MLRGLDDFRVRVQENGAGLMAPLARPLDAPVLRGAATRWRPRFQLVELLSRAQSTQPQISQDAAYFVLKCHGIVIALIVGFALGYGVREWVSGRRREAERQRRHHGLS